MILNMMGGGGSGGAELNFEVVGGTTQPTNPKENTIWCNTNVEITKWIFSATQPTEILNGFIWIVTGNKSEINFNALIQNEICINPLHTYQYVNGEWIFVTSMIYQNEKWNSWWDGNLYYLGNEYEEYTGGWERKYDITYGSNNTQSGTVTKNNDSMYFQDSGYTSFASITTANLINLTSYSTITFEGTLGKNFLVISIHDSNTQNIANGAVCGQVEGSKQSFDISELTGDFYITMGVWNGSSYTVTRVYLS